MAPPKQPSPLRGAPGVRSPAVLAGEPAAHSSGWIPPARGQRHSRPPQRPAVLDGPSHLCSGRRDPNMSALPAATGPTYHRMPTPVGSRAAGSGEGGRSVGRRQWDRAPAQGRISPRQGCLSGPWVSLGWGRGQAPGRRGLRRGRTRRTCLRSDDRGRARRPRGQRHNRIVGAGLGPGPWTAGDPKRSGLRVGGPSLPPDR